MRASVLVVFVVFFAALLLNCTADNVKHRFKVLTSRKVRSLAQCSAVDPLFEYDLPPILKPRVPGTPSHKEVKEYIIARLKQLGPRWTVTLDTFTQHTVIGEKTFTNIIATLDADVDRRLVLSAHYDSKIIDGTETTTKFVAATDSALPCALLLDMAHSLNTKLQSRKLEEYSLQLMFFDGEEAFVAWTATDSIYGSRHLADEMSHSGGLLSVGTKTGLESIETLILLDLFGAKDPTFKNFFSETSDMFERFMKIEQRLREQGELEGSHSLFPSSHLSYSHIEDDHIPFLRKGVPILHLIAYPFPPQWHKLGDNLASLHKPSISNMHKIFIVFLHEYFHLK